MADTLAALLHDAVPGDDCLTGPDPDCLRCQSHASLLRAAGVTYAPPSDPAAPLRDHEPGEAHQYAPLVCEVCGVNGRLVIHIEPQRAALAAAFAGHDPACPMYAMVRTCTCGAALGGRP